VLGPKVRVPEEYLVWPRRQLALLLAEQGDEGREEALALLDANRAAGEDPTADARARAFVRSARAAERQAAIRDVEATVTPSRPLAPEGLSGPARLYEADGDWEAARERLQTLLNPDGDPDNPEYLMVMVRGLLDHDAADEARPFLLRLKKFATAYPRC